MSNSTTAVLREVRIGPQQLPGILAIPPDAAGLVLFAHGSGSSHRSVRNQYVARQLQQAGFGSLLFDLLREQEAKDRRQVFNIELLATRLQEATTWVACLTEAVGLPLGYFGASTGAAAALVAASREKELVQALVSRGGRPDLAEACLAEVTAPTLLIVGAADAPVVAINQRALQRLQVDKEMALVPRATHLFTEPGALEQVAQLATDWFRQHLVLIPKHEARASQRTPRPNWRGEE